MISSRIPPLVRTFFSPTPTTVGRSEKDSSGQSGGHGEPERDATEEEARRALDSYWVWGLRWSRRLACGTLDP